MGFITNTLSPFPSIHITPIQDNTRVAPTLTRGSIMGVGFLNSGNPKKVLSIKSNPLPLLTTIGVDGGSIKNEQAYHFRDFFNKANSEILIGRALGKASTVEVVSFSKVSNTITIKKSTRKIGIWGANNIDDWKSVNKVDAIEVLLKFAPKLSTTISMKNNDNILTISIYDHNNVLVYTREGSCLTDSKDDRGNSNYIGNIVNTDIIDVKVNKDHSQYTSTFTEKKATFTDLLAESGAIDEDTLYELMLSRVGNADYISTLGLYDTTSRNIIKRLSEKQSLIAIYDVKGKTLVDAIADKKTIGADIKGVYLWERTSSIEKSGDFITGLSGLFLGYKIRTNLSKVINGVENRNTAIAGVDYPIDKIYSSDVKAISVEDNNTLKKERINTTKSMISGIIFGDIMNAETKKLEISNYPLYDAESYIQRAGARLIEQQLFKTMKKAILVIQKSADDLLLNASRNDFFDDAQEDNYKAIVSQVEGANDTVEIKFIVNGNPTITRGRVLLANK